MKLKYETGVWNWSMKRLWNWSMEWWMQLNPTSTYFRCKHGLHARIHLCMNTWILYGCRHGCLHQCMLAGCINENWYETGVKLWVLRSGHRWALVGSSSGWRRVLRHPTVVWCPHLWVPIGLYGVPRACGVIVGSSNIYPQIYVSSTANIYI